MVCLVVYLIFLPQPEPSHTWEDSPLNWKMSKRVHIRGKKAHTSRKRARTREKRWRIHCSNSRQPRETCHSLPRSHALVVYWDSLFEVQSIRPVMQGRGPRWGLSYLLPKLPNEWMAWCGTLVEHWHDLEGFRGVPMCKPASVVITYQREIGSLKA